MIKAGLFHQVIGGGPVAMAIQQRADDAATQHPWERFLVGLRFERRDDFVTFRKAANVQSLFISRATAKASHVGCVGFLKTFFHASVQSPMSNVQCPSQNVHQRWTLDFGLWTFRNCSRSLNLCTLPVAV